MTCKLLKMALFYTYICLFEEKMQKIHFFCRYANKILILIGNVLIFELIFVLLSALLSAFAPVHSLPNLKIYLFILPNKKHRTWRCLSIEKRFK